MYVSLVPHDPAFHEGTPYAPSSPYAASKAFRCRELITYVRDRPGHDRRYAIDPTKIRNRLEFAPSETLQSGFARTVDWYLANEPWWRAVIDRR